jgi:chorismate synthase
MSGTWGNSIKYTIFGESHGDGVGIVIDNLPPGLVIDDSRIKAEMHRRRPGNTNISTARNEQDEYEILSGILDGKTTGAPLCSFIRNTNQRSKDYDKTKELIRPGHADYTSFVKYKGFNDCRGGGHFSGRLTAAIVFAGAIAKQLLSSQNITIISHILKIGSICDTSLRNKTLNNEDYSNLSTLSFPTIDITAGEAMQQEIFAVQSIGDSIGGIVELAVLNLPAGIGSPFFDSLESTISHLVFSIPGVKGIEFGDGFDLAEMKGSEANDGFYIENNKIYTQTNHCGGILGGISTGMPLILRAAFKPTPSIAIDQNSVNIKNYENALIKVEGRHDPCIVPRAIPVVEAVTAMAILDCFPLTY